MRFTKAFRSSTAQFGFALAWTLLVMTGYYLVHKPIAIDQVKSVFRPALDILLALSLTCLAGGVGRRLLPGDLLSPLERFALQAAVGFGSLSLAWFVIGIAGFYRTWLAWVLLIFGLFVFRKQTGHWVRQLYEFQDAWKGAGRFGRLLAVGSNLLIAGQLPFALASPGKWDALLYHLDIPRRYLEAGRFIFIPENPIWGHPQLIEILYTWAIALRGLETATVLAWCIGVVLLVGIFGLAARYTSPTGGWLAVAALVCGQTFLGELSWGYVDNAAALYGLAGLAVLLAFVDSNDPRWLVWSGVFAGLALSVKYTAGILLLAMIAGVAFTLPASIRQKIRWVTQISVVAGFVFLPWLVKNLAATGNPVYPYFWPTRWTSEERFAFSTFRAVEPPPTWQAVGLPLAMTWLGVEGGGGFAADTGPLLVLFAVPGILGGWQNRRVRLVGSFLAVGWLVMAAGSRYSVMLHLTRLFYVLLPALGLTAAWGWSPLFNLEVAGVRLRRILIVFTLLVLGLSTWQQSVMLVRMNPFSSLFGLETGENYQDRTLGQYAPAMRYLSSLPAGSRVLFLWEARGLYAPVSAVPDSWTDRWYLDRRTIGDPVQILQSWKGQGFTHLLLFDLGAGFERQNRPEFTPEDWQALEDLLAGLPSPLRFGSAYSLYLITQ